MRVPIDIHWSWQHQGPEDLVAFAAIDPEAIWILNPAAEIVRQAHQACPQALIVLRDQPQGEQRDFMLRDPLGCAAAHMADWQTHIPLWAPGIPLSQIAVCGINEPAVGTLAGEIAACTYYTELVRLGTLSGIAVAAGAFGNGWPGNDDTPTVNATPVHWDRPHFKALLEMIRAGRKAGVLHFLNVHEYFGDPNGPISMWGWHCGRILQLLHWLAEWGWNPADVPIRLGELGFDRLATDPAMTKEESRGWQMWLTAEQYVAFLDWLYQQYGMYPSILGAGVFGWDAQARNWNGFDIRVISAKIVAMVRLLRALVAPDVAQRPLPADIKWPVAPPVVPPVIPPVVVPPVIVPPVASPTDRLVTLLKAAFGTQFQDLRSVLPRRASVPWFGKRDVAAITTIVGHHTAARSSLTWTQVASGELATHPTWPGIAYTIGVSPSGMVSLFADIDEDRGATGNSQVNSIGIQVCCDGNYEPNVPGVPTETPTAAMLAALRKLFSVLSAFTGKTLKIIGHRDVPGDQTACPGANLYAALFAPVAPPAHDLLPEDETATDAATLAQKVRWWTEEYWRQYKAGNEARAVAIMSSLIKLDGGLMYRLENALKVTV